MRCLTQLISDTTAPLRTHTARLRVTQRFLPRRIRSIQPPNPRSPCQLGARQTFAEHLQDATARRRCLKCRGSPPANPGEARQVLTGKRKMGQSPRISCAGLPEASRNAAQSGTPRLIRRPRSTRVQRGRARVWRPGRKLDVISSISCRTAKTHWNADVG